MDFNRRACSPSSEGGTLGLAEMVYSSWPTYVSLTRILVGYGPQPEVGAPLEYRLKVLLAICTPPGSLCGMIEREITRRLTTLFRQYPFVTVTGPRQSGKTTLCRSAFPDLEYANLEAPDVRDFAEADPRGFLAQFHGAVVIDEIQHVPELLSYLQVLADERGHSGQFVLTGSEQFRLSDSISQSLAGRTALLRLLPFSLSERRRTGASDALNDILFSGFYPRIHDRGLDPRQHFRDYFETYVERDVRRLGEIRNLSSFRRFVRLCAGRVGQLLNLTSLGSDAGVSHTTARAWLTILERSYIAFQLRPFHTNIRKRLTKSPKLYFYDVGLVSYLIGIERAEQVATHPLRGSLFENTAVVEALKYRFNNGYESNLSFFRDSKGLECDVFYETGDGIYAIEAKSGSTITSDYFRSLDRVAGLVPEVAIKAVVYGGTTRQSRSDGEVVPLADLGGLLQRLDTEREIAEFIEQRRGSAPDKSDIGVLDGVFYSHIRPLCDRLEPTIETIWNGLFRTFGQAGYIRYRHQQVSSAALLEARNWEHTKEHYVVSRGFKLSDDQQIEVKQDYRFTDYTGTGTTGFGIVLSIEWTLKGSSFSRHVTINEIRMQDLDLSVGYSEVESHSLDLDRAVAVIAGYVVSQIDVLSSGS